MCSSPDPPKVEDPEPRVMRNPFLDDARSDSALVDSLRQGRSQLRIPLSGKGSGPNPGFQSQTSAQQDSPTIGPQNTGTASARGSGIKIRRK